MEKKVAEFLSSKSVEDAAKILGSKKDSRFIRTVANLNRSTQRIQVPHAPNHFIKKDTSNQTSLGSIASSQMYNDIGILTPKIHFVDDNNKYGTTSLQQDVSSIDFLDTTLAGSDIEYSQIVHEFFGKEKWSVFYDSNLVHRLLQFMTPDCLEQLKNVFLIDELRTDVDRHTKNYFFYKTKGAEKYEGIITIDLEQMTIFFNCEGHKKDDFSNFLVMPYESATPQQKYDHICYMQRVKNIRELIQDGVLSQKNIEALKAALEHDFPADIKKAVKDKHLHGKYKKDIVDPIEYLWDYNRNTIGKDLEL